MNARLLAIATKRNDAIRSQQNVASTSPAAVHPTIAVNKCRLRLSSPDSSPARRYVLCLTCRSSETPRDEQWVIDVKDRRCGGQQQEAAPNQRQRNTVATIAVFDPLRGGGDGEREQSSQGERAGQDWSRDGPL